MTELLDFDGGRQVTVYRPEGHVGAVVFVADGGSHIQKLAAALDEVRNPPMIVGVDGMADDDERLKEYVPGFNEARFAAHERFFVEDVRVWVRDQLEIAFSGARTAIWGASLGGEFALAMGLGHPDVFGMVLSASPGAGYRPPSALQGVLPRVYLVAGDQEPFFLDNAIRWAVALRAAGSDVVMAERQGTHGGDFWYAEFSAMVSWAFGDESHPDS